MIIRSHFCRRSNIARGRGIVSIGKSLAASATPHGGSKSEAEMCASPPPWRDTSAVPGSLSAGQCGRNKNCIAVTFAMPPAPDCLGRYQVCGSTSTHEYALATCNSYASSGSARRASCGFECLCHSVVQPSKCAHPAADTGKMPTTKAVLDVWAG